VGLNPGSPELFRQQHQGGWQAFPPHEVPNND
jgi:hypothetical protein